MKFKCRREKTNRCASTVLLVACASNSHDSLTKRVGALAEGLNGLLQFRHVPVPVSPSATACAGGTPRFFRQRRSGCSPGPSEPAHADTASLRRSLSLLPRLTADSQSQSKPNPILEVTNHYAYYFSFVTFSYCCKMYLGLISTDLSPKQDFSCIAVNNPFRMAST